MKKIFLLLVILSSISSVNAQTIFESGEGEAILLRNADFKTWFNVRVNTSAESFQLSFNRNIDTAKLSKDGTRFFSYLTGLNFKVKTNSGIGNLVSSGKFNTGLSLGATFGRLAYLKVDSGQSNNPSSRYFSVNISYDKNTLLDQTNLLASDIKKLSIAADYHWNKLWVHQKTADKYYYSIFSVSGGYKLDNNLESLDDGVAVTTLASRPGFDLVTNEPGKIGDYERYHTFPITLDYGIMPRIFGANMIGFNAFARARINYPNSPVNMGAGVFFTKKGEPTNVVGGIGWQFKDVFNKGDQFKNAPVFVYLGYTIE